MRVAITTFLIIRSQKENPDVQPINLAFSPSKKKLPFPKQKSKTMPAPPPTHAILLFLDFDATLTTASTLPLLASASTYPDPHPVFGGLSALYADDLAGYKRGFEGGAGARRGWRQGEAGVLVRWNVSLLAFSSMLGSLLVLGM